MTLRGIKIIKNAFTHLVLIIFSLIILLPVLWIIRTSLAPEVVAYEIPPKLFFMPTLKHYAELFSVNRFQLFFKNSLIISVGSTLISVPIAALGGYAFARYRTGGRALQFGVIGTQMLPGVVLILPIFVIFTVIKLTDSLLGMILAYMAFNIPFLVWILMGFFDGIPQDIEEAAAIDGLSPLGILFRIVIPVATPGIMSSSILSFIMCWNEFLFALILTGSSTHTIPVSLAAMVTQRGVLIGKVSAGTALAIIPMIIISFFVKKYLVKGLTLGAVK
jgi:multiple sugar transport system permease protein